MEIIDLFQRKKKQLAILIDPDKQKTEQLIQVANTAEKNGVDYFFVGGSLMTNDDLNKCIRTLKENCELPVILFPGNTYQISRNADAILFLSLISSRNPDALIGMHVIGAPFIKLAGLKTVATGYMLIDSGRPTSVTYMSNSFPIPYDKNDIAACTAMAGEMLGHRLIFMDAGSGADKTVSEEMISFVKQSIDVPLVIGGGIRTPEKLKSVFAAGADIAVVGNVLENSPELIADFAKIASEF
jgi:phosphoglycerol geranylgeranyltransferase